jgi:hypothetical protein
VLKYSARTTTFFKQLRVRKNRAKRDATHHACALVRRNAISRLKIRPGPSRPGASPHAHSRGGLRVIRYHVSGNTGIVGPVKFPRSKLYNKPVPAIHEFGGQVFTIGRFFRVFNFKRRPYMSKTIKALRKKLPKAFSLKLGRVL